MIKNITLILCLISNIVYAQEYDIEIFVGNTTNTRPMPASLKIEYTNFSDVKLEGKNIDNSAVCAPRQAFNFSIKEKNKEQFFGEKYIKFNVIDRDNTVDNIEMIVKYNDQKMSISGYGEKYYLAPFYRTLPVIKNGSYKQSVEVALVKRF